MVVVGDLSCCYQTQLVLPNKRGDSCLSVPSMIPECRCSRENPGGERVGAHGERAAVVPAK